MKFLRDLLDKQEEMMKPGAKLEQLYPLHEATDTFFFTPDKVTNTGAHVRDALDLKRMMITVVIALIPCVLMAMYNSGLQANLAISNGLGDPAGWRGSVVEWLGLGFSPESILSCIVHGALFYIPVLLVTFIVGGNIEALFAIVRKHEINEGFLVTGMLFPLILPPTIPLWQVAIGIAFGVIIGKEVFGGTGMNILNVALTARAFLFFAYPAEISGDLVWVAADNYSGPTLLAASAIGGSQALGDYSWMDAFLGFIPGSMGETSTLACIFGAVILLATKVANWRTMLGAFIGSLVIAVFFNMIAGFMDNPFFEIPIWWHVVLGGWAFGVVFMATDPVSSSFTDTGKWFYGFGIGALAIMIRVVNPAYPEGVMLAILFMNVFASTIDHFVVEANIKRRLARNATV